MAPDDKPYRVYRGGRVKGKVPAPSRPRPGRALPPAAATQTRTRTRRSWRNWRPHVPKRPPWKRLILILVLVLVSLFVAWAITSYLSVRNGVKEANHRLQPGTKAALAKQDGLLLSNGTTILLLGTDTGPQRGRSGDRHSDSIMLVRTDPDHHRLAYLSIPRDLLVPVPGLGNTKINAAYQAGGAPLAIRTIREYTGLKINHVVVVDFSNFKELIDAVGGITVNVPSKILSNRFDCPFKTEQRCSQWEGWRFAKGTQHMNGQRALIYSRIRENQYNPSESDITRGARQQQVLTAIEDKLAGPGTFFKLPFIGGSLLKPLATDLSAGQFLQLGWVKFRGHTLRCRLGGIPTNIGGGAYLQPDEEARAVIQMVKGTSAPQPPLPGSLYGSGCTSGG
jgi:LCP family protein required for cell wall assembly